MAQLIEYKGQTFTINDPENTYSVTDDKGRSYTFDQYGIHNPKAHKAFKFTTVQSVVKWWVANRESFNEQLDEESMYLLVRSMDVYFDTWDSYGLPITVIKECLSGWLRNPSLYIEQRSSSQHFILLVNPSQEVPHMRVYKRRACISVDPSDPINTTSEDTWSRHYNYTYKMDPDTFGFFRSVKNENSVFFGLELEVNTKLTTTEIQKIITDVEPKQEPFFILKQDSSITGKYHNYFEIVTVPCTPRYLRKNFKIFFQKIERLCAEKNLSVSDVFDTRSDLNNGLHIHVSKESFMDMPHYNKFLCVWNQWNKSCVNFFNMVSGRPTDYTKNTYCKINRSYEGVVLSRRLKGLRTGGDRSVAHDNSGKTIEVRVYQGIFDLKHIMQCISFTEAVFEYCQNIGYSGFDGKFVRKISQFVRQHRKFASLYEVFDKAISK